MDNKEIFRLKSSVALVYSEGILDIFLSNLREQLKIEIQYEKIIELLFSFDGENSFYDIHKNNPNIEIEELESLIEFLVSKRALINVNEEYNEDLVLKNYRIINFLEDYCFSTKEVISSIEMLRTKRVMVVGMGAVGTWIVDGLARTGVKNFTLVDDDIVELSNIHRQDMFFESDVGRYKVDSIEDRLLDIYPDISVDKIKERLMEDFFHNRSNNYDLIVNCADFPSVDITTKIISKYCMENKIPHIVGGGYNLHLTLIGQTVIPNKTACVKCFENHLKKINNADLDGVKKLARETRKIGSFAPLSSIAAALASIDAIKILINKYSFLSNSNKRIEFNIRERDIKKHDVNRDENCEWCGKNGIYF